jgi:hypothetical protein
VGEYLDKLRSCYAVLVFAYSNVINGLLK